MQTHQTNLTLPSTMSTTTFSNNSGHRRLPSGELDVFEASRYFSGDIDGLPLGFGSWSTTTKKNNYIMSNKNKSLELIPTQQQQQQQEALAIDHEIHDKQNKVEKKKKKKKRAPSCKSLNSPTAKLANYLHSFLLQRSSKKKPNIINSKSKNKIDDDVDDHLHPHHHPGSMSFRSYSSDCSKSYYSTCVYGTVPIIAEAQAAKNYYIDRRINGDYYYKSSREYYFGDEVALEVEDDGEISDSSSDLFELRNMEAIGSDGPNDLPVYGTTSFDVAIATAILL